MRRTIPLIALATGLAGCGSSEQNSEVVEKMTEAMLMEQYLNSSRPDLGRYQYYPAEGDMPALLLDTATGCIEKFEKLTAVDDSTKVTWARRYFDSRIPLAKEDGEGKRVTANTAPPSRCPVKYEQAK